MTPAGVETCPRCGARYSPDEAFCWMCGRRLWEPDAKAPASPGSRPRNGGKRNDGSGTKPGDADLGISESVLLLAVTVVFIGSLTVPGLAFPALALLAPILLVLLIKSPQGLEHPRTPSERFAKALNRSVKGVTISILGVLALFVAAAAWMIFILAEGTGQFK